MQLHREDEANTARLLRAGAVVAAITVDPAPVAGCAVTALGAMRYRPMAAPGFAARWFPDGPAPEALARAPMMVFDRDDAMQHDYLATRAPGADPPQTMVPSSSDFVAAIGLGLGWGMVADLQRPGGPGARRARARLQHRRDAAPAALAAAHAVAGPAGRGDRRRRPRAARALTGRDRRIRTERTRVLRASTQLVHSGIP